MATTTTTTEAREITTHTVELDPSRYRDDVDQWNSAEGHIVSLYARYTRRTERFSILYVGPEGSCRLVHGGPIVPGPHAFLIPQCTVVAAVGGTGAESARNRAAGTEVELRAGDRLVLNGLVFEIQDEQQWEYPQLVRVPCEVYHPHTLVVI